MSEENNTQDMGEELTELRKVINRLNKRATNLEEKIGTAEAFVENFDEIRDKIQDPEEGLDAQLGQAGRIRDEIDQIKTDAEQELESVKSNITEMETAYAAFTAIRDKVNNGETGMEALLTFSNTKKSEIDSLKNQADEKLTQIENNLTKVQSHVSDMEEAFESFEAIKEKVFDEESGLEAIFIEAEDLKSKILATKKSATDTHLEIEGLKKESEKLNGASSDIRDEIESYRKESEGFKTSIGETLELVTDSSLNNAFIKRKKELMIECGIWGGVFVLGLIGLGFAVLYIYSAVNTNGDLNTQQMLLRFLFTSPIIFLIYEASKNYSKAREMLEKYSFKSVMSTTLASYLKLLKSKFPENPEILREFTIKQMEVIYKEPYADKNIKRRFSFGQKQLGNADFEIEEEVINRIIDRAQRGGIRQINKGEEVTEKVKDVLAKKVKPGEEEV